MMKIIQVAHALTYADAASNQVIAMDKMFKRLGYESKVYAEKIDNRLNYAIQNYSELIPSPDIIYIYHFSTGTSFIEKVLNYPYPIVIYYHNITPANFFWANAWGSYFSSIKGRKQLRLLREKTLFAWAASKYSRNELEQVGFKNTAVLPIIIDLEIYKHTEMNERIINSYQDNYINMLCVGRVTYHKKQEHAIRVLYYYKKFINLNARLFIVGGAKKQYQLQLKKLAEYLKIDRDVIFTGKISFSDLCTYYKCADLALSFSEHEGFCVPLIESMIFEKPIFAMSRAAVPDTMGQSGVLFDDVNPAVVAEMIHHVVTNKELLDSVIAAQSMQLKGFALKVIAHQLEKNISEIIELYPKGVLPNA